jgi:hypothetical protein
MKKIDKLIAGLAVLRDHTQDVYATETGRINVWLVNPLPEPLCGLLVKLEWEAEDHIYDRPCDPRPREEELCWVFDPKDD